VRDYERLGGEYWTQSFRVTLSIKVNKLYAELYRKKPPQVRDSTYPKYRNKLGKYPCGLLDQAYRELKGEASGTREAVPEGTRSEGGTVL
jgi:hypothetical protein